MTATLEAPAASSVTPSDDDVPEPPPTPRPVPAALQPWRDPHPVVGWLIPLAIGVIAGLTRFWALGTPRSKVFDEVYYATEAQEILRYGYEDNRDYMFIVHPPLGKWLIGFTEAMFGHPGQNALGWRFAGATVGVLSVVIMARLARRMFRSNLFGAIAGLLLTMEGLSLVLARTAILDIFLQFFVLAGFAALVVDRDHMRGRLARMLLDGVDVTARVPSLGPRPWRLLGGALLGAACAVKWTGAWFFIGFVLLSVVWDRSAMRAAGCRRPMRSMWRRSILPATGSLLAAPIAAYLLSYIGWFTGENSWGRHWTDTHPSTVGHFAFHGLRIPLWWGWVPSPIRSLGAYTLDAYHFHTGLTSFHPYRSNPWSWLVLGRPVDFYYDGSSHACGAATCSRTILALGTPLMWWAFLPMLVWLAWHWVTTRDWRAGSIWIAFIAGWVVWFIDLKRTMFFFYMAPLVPFLILGLTLALGTLLGPALRRTGDAFRDRRALLRRYWGLGGVAVFLGAVTADFVWMWPIFTGGLLTEAQWHAHMWLPSWV
ncbi:MAG: dolichyl-phosphate-mannose-protein mannosyltransferase [Pseudonocardiales bacterium]|nr:dolichyl-phosphate-mannose-protein mannosyltransferase [Pseudonocardiales bacterium]